MQVVLGECWNRLRYRIYLGANPLKFRGTDPVTAFPHGLSQNHDFTKDVFLADDSDYQTFLARFDPGVQRNHSDCV